MHAIEPYHNWRHIYIASEDDKSPFWEREYSEFEFSNKIYNYYIHPQWDYFGSQTIYLKILFTDYEKGYAIIELIGEWNDCIDNDIMTLKRNVLDQLMGNGITRFILIGENVLNFHCSDDCYYSEWFEEVVEEGGWIVGINFREHVRSEMQTERLHHFINLGEQFTNFTWRPLAPQRLCELIERIMERSIGLLSD